VPGKGDCTHAMPEVIFNGPDGRLEGRYHHGKSPNAPLALLLHPHPQHGGTMNNKVVYALYHAFVRRGFSTLRFNFRGVGRSQGKFDNGQGELSDAASALDWMQSFNANASACWVGGFSFGAWIGMQLLMRRPEIDGFVSVAPPANVFDFSFLAPCPSSGLIVHGTNDDLVPEPTVAKLAAKLATQRNIKVRYQTIEGANHFFGTHLEALDGMVDAYLGESMVTRPAAPPPVPEPELAVALS
jgi:alpha/beta superfamily hydrolase